MSVAAVSWQSWPAQEPMSEFESDPVQVARIIALRRLHAAPRSRAELAEDLRKRGIPEEAAEEVLDRFTEVGLIDDAAYASAWVGSRHRGCGLARPVLRRELQAKGIAAQLVEEALDVIDDAAEIDRARALAVQRLPSLIRLDAASRQRRLIGFLMRRGYPVGVAAQVTREVLGAQADE
ncbi:MAG: regulatory protein RecX [Actinomycetales bacterium]